MSRSREPSRVYQNHHLDSTRWRVFEPREDDVIITTSYKSGTTWMQQIFQLLVFGGDPEAPPAGLASPWLDARFQGELDDVAKWLDSQTHQRFVKSHLPFDGLPYYEQARYVVVTRDARDVFMSLWNHYSSYTDDLMARLNGNDRVGEPLPAPPGEDGLRETWRNWMTRGWFPWESEGWPFWGNLHHTKTYWEHRDLGNVLFVNYLDLLADPAAEIARVAEFAHIDVTPALLELAVEGSHIDAMKKTMRETGVHEMMKDTFRIGSDAIVNKGTNGRWRGVLTDDDLGLYDEAKERVLPADCAKWLEQGRASDVL
jgi:aryl sulfotransferase